MLGPVEVDGEVNRLHRFWFGELVEGFADSAHRQRWFSGGPEFDELCRTEFGTLLDSVSSGGLRHWLDEPRSRLAFIVLCDQIPRNVFRGRAEAFASDATALAAARDGVEAGMDRTLTPDERCFFYLPFEHSESLVDQHACVGLFTDLRDATAPGSRHITGDYLRYAQQHRDIIKRFGRFPHRNAALGREPTAAERDYLRDGPSFGQAGS